jgi:hypothetical protein
MSTCYDKLLDLIRAHQKPSIPQSSIFVSYQAGLRELVRRVKDRRRHHVVALTYQQRLTENILESQQYGNTEPLRTDRARIISSLNGFTLSVIGSSFFELCGLSESVGELEPSEYLRQISALAKKALQFPLCLVSMPQSSELFVRRLEGTRSKLEDSATDEASKMLELAIQSLGVAEFRYVGLTRLFRAGVWEKLGDYEKTKEWADKAYKCFPSEDHLPRMVAMLIQGNNHINNGRNAKRSIDEARDAYGEAIWRLEELEKEAEPGKQDEAELYRVLKDSLRQHADEILTQYPGGRDQRWPFFEYGDEYSKAIPFGVLPVYGKIPAGAEKTASDDIIGYIQTDELEFNGHKLNVVLLNERSQLIFLPEYAYVAVRVLGDSMDLANICHNDYVILMKKKVVDLSPRSGDIVAVVFRDENDDKATLKRIRIESKKVTLKPESSNPVHESRTLLLEAFAAGNPAVDVVGIAIAVLKP